jgi:hypothetical protein
VRLNFSLREVPSFVCTAAQFSCILPDVVQTFTDLGVKVKKGLCRLSCHLDNGMRSYVKEIVRLHFLLGKFSWNFQFKILEGGPFPIILGLDFLSHSKMVMDLGGRK